ncbi:hypothetical protein [Streptomyces sp. NPDC021096]|uniref:hypothetical protein n=1 Tax=Streptomyces sp. NPDC021096 TaxID=3154792 RepID=UPI00340E080B
MKPTGRLKRRAQIIASTAAAVVSVGLFAAPAAHADWQEDENFHSTESCKPLGVSQFKLHMWFNSGQNGAHRAVGYSIYDFGNGHPVGNASGIPMMFCNYGGAGSGKSVKNAVASAENDHGSYMARIYTRSGWYGDQDPIAPYQHLDRLNKTYNDNASFKWT